MALFQNVEHATCAQCGYRFSHRDDYRERGLANPTRCLRCRAERREARRNGVVKHATSEWVIIVGEDGREFYGVIRGLGFRLTRGARVSFLPGENGGGRRARARCLRVVE